LDNSEWMRNGDYTPTRMEAQHDAVNLICGAKTQQNPENTVAAVAGAGKSPEVLVTLTSDLGKLLSSLHDIKFGANLNFMQAIQVAQLVLKHRQNKSQHQRIIFFVGSPILDSTDDLVKLAKRLKKNNVAVDVVNFGEEEANTTKLEAFMAAVKSSENSSLVNIPPGPHVLSDIIISSPIITGNEESGTAPTSGTAPAPSHDFSQYGGVDPNLDPELALALKVSLEEAKANQEKDKKPETPAQTPAPQEKPVATTPTAQPQQQQQESVDMSDVGEDDDLLQQAIAMSMGHQQKGEAPKPQQQTPAPSTQPKPQQQTTTTTTTKDTVMEDAEDAEMALALQMSMQNDKKETVDINKVMEDPNFVNSVLSSLPGVDPNDETIRSVLQSISKPEQKDDKDKKDKDKK